MAKEIFFGAEILDRKKALVIMNPNSGKMKSRKGLYIVINALNKNGFETTVYCTTAPKEAIEIVSAKAAEFDVLVCCGGDGTLNEVITGFMKQESSLPIGYIPTGTTNDLANTLKLPKDILKATEVVIKGNQLDYDIGMLNDAAYFSYVASFGAFSTVSYATPQWLKNKIGYFAYALQAIRGIGTIKPYKVKIKADGVDIKDEFIFGSVTNTTSIGKYISLPSEKVNLDDGLYEVMLIRNPKNGKELRKTLNGLLNQKYDDCGIIFTHAKHITFAFDTAVEWTTDGEYGGKYGHVDIRVIQDRVQIIQPQDERPS